VGFDEMKEGLLFLEQPNKKFQTLVATPMSWS
jgi:hypothetical protein